MKKKSIYDYVIYTTFVIFYTISVLILKPSFVHLANIELSAKGCFAVFIAIYCFTAILTVLNKSCLNAIIISYAVITNVVLLFVGISENIVNLTFINPLMWMTSVFIASGGVYSAISLINSKDAEKQTRMFWISFLPTYFYSFILSFIRKPNGYYELNLKLGNGLFSTFDYMIANKFNTLLLLSNFLGNLFYFIPVIFIVKSVFKRLKNYQALLLCLLIPLIIEGYQYIFKCGNVDVDDLLLNYTSILLSYMLYNIEYKRHTKKDKN